MCRMTSLDWWPVVLLPCRICWEDQLAFTHKRLKKMPLKDSIIFYTSQTEVSWHIVNSLLYEYQPSKKDCIISHTSHSNWPYLKDPSIKTNMYSWYMVSLERGASSIPAPPMVFSHIYYILMYFPKQGLSKRGNYLGFSFEVSTWVLKTPKYARMT